MANTYQLITSSTLTTTASTVTLSAIPNTYDDLVLELTYRIDAAGQWGNNPHLRFNGDSSSIYNNTVIASFGTSSSGGVSTSNNLQTLQSSNSAGNTANTFTSTQIYIPNYVAAVGRQYAITKVGEQFATNNESHYYAATYMSTTAISSITFTSPSSNFIAGSSFFLYGIKKT